MNGWKKQITCLPQRKCCCCNKKTFRPNSQLVEYVAKYSNRINIVFDSVTKDAIITYDQLLYSDIYFTCNGDGPAKDILVTYKLYLPDIGIPLARRIRQYFQFQKIPIDFVITNLHSRLVGNVVLEIYIDNVLFTTLKNAFYYITPPLIAPEPIEYMRDLRLVYTGTDEDIFKASPYFCEPLIPQRITNGCYGC